MIQVWRQYAVTDPLGKQFQVAQLADGDELGALISNRKGAWDTETQLSLADLIMPEQELDGWDVEELKPARDEESFKESDHPRDPDGKFASGSGSSANKHSKVSWLGTPALKGALESLSSDEFFEGLAQSDVSKLLGKFDTYAEAFQAAKAYAAEKLGSAAPAPTFGGHKGVTAAQGDPIDPSKMTKVSAKKGSNEGGIYEDNAGNRYYVKHLKSAAHKTNEYTAAGLYQLAGVKTLTYRPTVGPTDIATKLAYLDVDNVKDLNEAERKQAQSDFAIHAWLANWDAVGTGGDNIGIVAGSGPPAPTVLDTGGALEFRTQGEPKGETFGTFAHELETMRDPAIAPDASALYGKMSQAFLKDSVERVADIKDDDIRATVAANGGSPELAEKLIARKFNMAQAYGLKVIEEIEDPEFASKHPRNPDGTFKKGIGSQETSVPVPKGTAEKAWLGGYKTPATKEEAGSQISSWLTKPAVMNSNYRAVAKKLLDDADKFGFPDVAKNAIKKKILESMQLQHAHFVKTGKVKEQAAIEKKLKAWGSDLKTAPTVAPASAPTVSSVSKEDLEKAKNSGALPTNTYQLSPEINKQIEAFNEKYAGKTLTSVPELEQKVLAFKAIEAEKKKQYEAKIAAVAEQQKKEAEAHAAEVKEAMKVLNISPHQAEAFTALAQMHGGSYGSFLKNFQSQQKTAEQLGYPLSGFEAALIVDYTRAGSESVNAALRQGHWTDQQDVYVKVLNQALQKMPRYEGICTRRVFLSGSDFDKARDFYRSASGKVFEERSFQSSHAGDKSSGDASLVFKITATGKRAAHIKSLSEFPGEDEVLFCARTAFKISKVDESTPGKMVVHMTEWD